MLAEGKVKVLDFGLAKAYDTPTASADVANSPTMVSMAATSAGVILETAAYMSPEQAKGRVVDRRTDIFAFGCVLDEMLTAKKAFDGEDVTDILGAVLRVEPDWSQLPEGLPAGVRRLLRLCIEKNPRNRRSDATDIRLDLDHLLNEPAAAAPAPIEIPQRHLWARAAPVVSALVIGGILSGAAIWALRPAPAAGALTRFAVTLPHDQHFSATGRKFIAVSRDGSAMASRRESAARLSPDVRAGGPADSGNGNVAGCAEPGVFAGRPLSRILGGGRSYAQEDRRERRRRRDVRSGGCRTPGHQLGGRGITFGREASYVSTGHIVYAHQGALFAVPST